VKTEELSGSELDETVVKEAARLLAESQTESGLIGNATEFEVKLRKAFKVVLVRTGDGKLHGLFALKEMIGGDICPMSEAGFFVVSPDSRGRGVGKKLSAGLDKAIENSKLTGTYANILVGNYPSLKMAKLESKVALGTVIAGFDFFPHKPELGMAVVLISPAVGNLTKR
jgi:GNAT superfamily N-acetyltransferase